MFLAALIWRQFAVTPPRLWIAATWTVRHYPDYFSTRPPWTGGAKARTQTLNGEGTVHFEKSVS